MATVCDNLSPHLTTRKDNRIGQWATVSNVEVAYTLEVELLPDPAVEIAEVVGGEELALDDGEVDLD